MCCHMGTYDLELKALTRMLQKKKIKQSACSCDGPPGNVKGRLQADVEKKLYTKGC